MDNEDRIEAIVGELQILRPGLQHAVAQLSSDLDAGSRNTAPSSPDYWREVAFHDGLRRILIILDENYVCLNTTMVLSTTRYLFELSIWYKLLERDVGCGYVYASKMMDDAVAHARAQLSQTVREIKVFKELHDEDMKISQDLANSVRIGKLPKEAIGQAMRNANADIDARARRSFLLYAAQAKHNGYGFQAHLLEKALPQLQALVEGAEAERAKLKSSWPQYARAVKYDPRFWTNSAKSVDMEEEYQYVYKYTSRLLHANPGSITTNQPKLELAEMSMFLDFEYVAISDCLDIARRVFKLAPPLTH